MEHRPHISLYLDTRRTKGNGKYPLKLRVFVKEPREQKLYLTRFELTADTFKSAWETTKPRQQHKQLRQDLNAVLVAAQTAADNLSLFTFEAFEKALHHPSASRTDVVWYFWDTITTLHEAHRFNTETSYYSALRSLLDFKYYQKKKGSIPADFPLLQDFRTNGAPTYTLDLREITPKWLEQYEQYVVKGKGQSLTTVGMYLRNLRAIFNTAIDEKNIDQEYYPFGEKKYQIPAPRGVKKALNRSQLVDLFGATPTTPQQETAKAYWFFSFATGGMNLKDLAYLRYENIEGDRISFYREKTKRSTKTNLKPISAYLTQKSWDIIHKYGNPNTHPKQFVFPIISEDQTEEEQHTAIRSFNRFLNQHLKPLAVSVGISSKVSAYWARHSFSTQTLRMGKSIEFVSEALGHTDIKTTQRYFAGFEDEESKAFMDKLMDF